MAEVNFSYPRVLIGRQPNTHINCLSTAAPANRPLSHFSEGGTLPSRVGLQYGRRRLARNVIWFVGNLWATANALFSHVSKAIF